tara:strand:+ start:1027 stop:1329 length:303 start_codon:yes stop_codon:yes gene_type:complete
MRKPYQKLEINGFPQHARWKVTNKDWLSQITEMTGCTVTVKGLFYPPGKQPEGDQEPKLYLHIEGLSNKSVGSAKREIESILAGAAASSHTERFDKYNVV